MTLGRDAPVERERRGFGDFEEELVNKMRDLQKQVDDLTAPDIPQEIIATMEELEHTHPQVTIRHELPILLKDTQVEKIDIKIQNFIEDFYDIRERCKRKGFLLRKYLQDHPTLGWGEVVNKLAFDIYKYTRQFVTYKYDKTKYGFNEFWQLPQLTHYLGEGDCEDSANLLMSYFKAAGLPAWAFRNTCGMSSLGGHSTVYAYDFKDKKWRHLEATSRTTGTARSFHSLPDKKTKDELWIDDVWYSFNWEAAYHLFETSAAEDTFPENFVIEPLE